MLVYGDAATTEDAESMRARILRRLAEAGAMAAGLERHAALAAVFIEAGELAQGVADAEFAEHGCDARTPAQDAVMGFLLALAKAVGLSWDSGFRRLAPVPPAAVARLTGARLPDRITVKRPEGYAFYALYPEAYWSAARGLGPERCLPPERLRVVGLRSIGTGLAAIAAAAAGAPAPITLRPVGHPFRRELALSENLRAELFSDPHAQFAVVDEGPGLSGSSFGAVADVLEDHGVAPERITFLPGHAGDLGSQASPRHRARWARAARPVVDFDTLVLRALDPAHRLEAWAADLVGEPEGPLEDLSGGAWRARVYAREAAWPPANVGQERRKILMRTRTGAWLLKFAGLGREGERKLSRAQALHAAGLTPEPAGFRHGFLIERWIESARPLDPRACDRDALIAFMARYLAFRARAFPAGPERGASLGGLLAMARRNAAEALGEDWARRLDAFAPDAVALEGLVRRIETDNRLHAWEWLIHPDGRLVKTDALDHHAAHDLVGCQDVAWDVAGAVVELGLDAAERQDLCARIGREMWWAVDPDLLALCLPCYLAFQMGAFRLAAEALAGWPEEAARLRTAAGRYAERLRAEFAKSL